MHNIGYDTFIIDSILYMWQQFTLINLNQWKKYLMQTQFPTHCSNECLSACCSELLLYI